jgi:hypothetical protein
VSNLIPMIFFCPRLDDIADDTGLGCSYLTSMFRRGRIRSSASSSGWRGRRCRRSRSWGSLLHDPVIMHGLLVWDVGRKHIQYILSLFVVDILRSCFYCIRHMGLRVLGLESVLNPVLQCARHTFHAPELDVDISANAWTFTCHCLFQASIRSWI